jgi:predicted SnoaL-like aldol condensation-catalyzing enzyme
MHDHVQRMGGEAEDYLHDAAKPIRTIAEGEFVVLHARLTPTPGAEPYAVADIFRLRESRIVEHRDIVAHPPNLHLNPNSRF